MQKRVRWALCAALVLVLAGSVFYLVRHEMENRRRAQEYADAQERAFASSLPVSTPAPSPTPPPEPTPEPDPWALELALTDLDALREVNPEVVGWVRIPETDLSYPLMYSGDNAYYLSHTWTGEPNAGGAIFLEQGCAPDFSDFNIIIYGHRMTDTSMFGTLRLYTDREFWREHPRVYLVDDDWVYCFDIFSVYEANVRDLTYGLSITREEDKRYYANYCADRASYPTGITPTGEDPVLTMSTCIDMGQSDYRWVVQGVLAEKYPAGGRKTG